MHVHREFARSGNRGRYHSRYKPAPTRHQPAGGNCKTDHSPQPACTRLPAPAEHRRRVSRSRRTVVRWLPQRPAHWKQQSSARWRPLAWAAWRSRQRPGCCWRRRLASCWECQRGRVCSALPRTGQSQRRTPPATWTGGALRLAGGILWRVSGRGPLGMGWAAQMGWQAVAVQGRCRTISLVTGWGV